MCFGVCAGWCVCLNERYRDPDYDELEHDELVESEMQCGRCIISGITLALRVANLATMGAGLAIMVLGFWMVQFLNDNRASMDLQMAFMHLVRTHVNGHTFVCVCVCVCTTA